MAEAEDKTRGQRITAAQAAVLLGRSERWVYNLVQGGYITKEAYGQYSVVAVVRGAMAYMDEQIAKMQKSAAGNRATDARTREFLSKVL